MQGNTLDHVRARQIVRQDVLVKQWGYGCFLVNIVRGPKGGRGYACTIRITRKEILTEA
jgi:hypothetical protein